MSLYGISNGYARPLPTTPQPAGERGVRPQGAPATAQPTPAPATGLRAPGAAPGAAAALPAEAPAGTDPALWSVLSAEERTYFAKAHAMGPLTYGRKMVERQTPTLAPNRGVRLDVRG